MSLSTFVRRLTGAVATLTRPAASSALICKHLTRRDGIISAFGVMFYQELPLNEHGTIDYCHKCLSRMAVRCGKCGQPIFIGQVVGLTPLADKEKVIEYAVEHIEGNRTHYVACCIKMACSGTGPGLIAFWTAGIENKGQLAVTPYLISQILRNDGHEQFRKALNGGNGDE